MKKNIKLFSLILVAFFISIVSVNAKEMNVNSLGEEALAYDENAGYIFVVGKYAYTSNYQDFKIQDIMLASADSIILDKENVTNIKDLLSSMTIYRIERIYDDNFQAIGWKLDSNEIGNGTAFGDGTTEVDIRYINYNYIKSAIIDPAIKAKVESLNSNAASYGFDKITYENHTATFYIDDPSRSLAAYKDSGIVELIKEFVNGNYGAVSVAYGNNGPIDVKGLEDDDIISLAAEVLKEMAGDVEVLNYASVANKSMNAVVTYIDEDGNTYTETYTLTFVYDFVTEKEEILTNAAAELDSTVKENEDYGFRGVTFVNNVLTFDIADPEVLLAKFKDSGIVELFKDNYAGAIKVEYTTENGGNTITLTGSETDEDIEGFALEVLKAMVGDGDLTLGSVAGKTATATVTYADGSIATYTLTFTYDIKAVKNDALTEAANELNTTVTGDDKYGFRSVKYENNKLTFDILDPTALLATFKDSGIVNLFLENYKGATKVDYTTSNGKSGSIDLAEEGLTEENVRSYAAEVLKAMIDDDADLTLGSVAGRTATATVTYNTGDVVVYTLEFTYNVEEAKDEVLGDAATTLASEIASRSDWGFKTVTYDATQNLAKFEIADPTANLSQFKDSTVVELFKEFIKGAASVVYYIGDEVQGSESIDLTQDLDDTEIEGYAAEILTKMAGEGVDLTLGAVAGKKAHAVVTYANGETGTYYLEFAYDVETVKDEALTNDAQTLNNGLANHPEYGFDSIVYDAETKTATFTVSANKGETLLSQFKDSGIVGMFQEIVKGAKSISYTVEGKGAVNVPMENLEQEETVVNLAAELLQAMVGQDNDLTLKNVIGKTATATINYGYGDPITYTLVFNQTTAE